MRVPATGVTRCLLAALLLHGHAISTAAIQPRQTWTGIYAHDFTLLGCRPIILIFCRETIGLGNMGDKVGPQLSNGLKLIFGVENVATEGVNYQALPDTNYLPWGAPAGGIAMMQSLLDAAATQCPGSTVVASGYSQGAAVTHGAIFGLAEAVKDRIAGVVTFGDTRTLQNGGTIVGFPENRTFIICNDGDVICAGTLLVYPVHLDYTRRVPEAVAFLMWRILSGDSLKVIAASLMDVVPSLPDKL